MSHLILNNIEVYELASDMYKYNKSYHEII